MRKVYHLIDHSSLCRAKETGEHSPASLVEEGFVHLAYREQLAFVIKHFLAGQQGICLLELDSGKLNGRLVDEAPAGIEDDGQLYPHLYAPLNISAMHKCWELNIEANGECELPV